MSVSLRLRLTCLLGESVPWEEVQMRRSPLMMKLKKSSWLLPQKALALDAKETEAALRRFEADNNSDGHPRLDIDRTGLDDDELEESVLEAADSSSADAKTARANSESVEALLDKPATDVPDMSVTDSSVTATGQSSA